MSKFNKTTRGTNKIETTVTYNNAVAYKLSAHEELFDLVSTCMVSDKFYETQSEVLARIRKLICECNHVFVAKLAIYCRTKLNLRTISLVMLVELAKIHNGDSLISKAVTRTLSRADELADILAYYQMSNKTNLNNTKKLSKLSNQLKKGIADAFYKFDRYHFQKYNRQNEVRIRDALFLTHPKPQTIDQEILFKDIAQDTLGVPDTWETRLSEEGKKGSYANKKECWESFIDEHLYECEVIRPHN